MIGCVKVFGIEFVKTFTGSSIGEYDQPVRNTVQLNAVANKISDLIFFCGIQRDRNQILIIAEFAGKLPGFVSYIRTYHTMIFFHQKSDNALTQIAGTSDNPDGFWVLI